MVTLRILFVFMFTSLFAYEAYAAPKLLPGAARFFGHRCQDADDCYSTPMIPNVIGNYSQSATENMEDLIMKSSNKSHVVHLQHKYIKVYTRHIAPHFLKCGGRKFTFKNHGCVTAAFLA